MRKYIGILVCLLVCLQLNAVSYHPCKPTAFRTTSAYVAPIQTTAPTMSMSMQRPLATGSFSAISASNFETLNSEDGWCAATSASASKPHVRKGGRPDEDDDEGDDNGNAIGEYDFHSPIGDTPWILLGLLLIAYGAFTWKKKSAEI